MESQEKGSRRLKRRYRYHQNESKSRRGLQNVYIYNNVEANNHHGARKSHHIFTDAVAWNALNLNNETFKLYYNHSVMKYDYLRPPERVTILVEILYVAVSAVSW